MSKSSLRARIATLLAPGKKSDSASRRVDLALIILILANVVAIMLESEPAIHSKYHNFFWWFEVFSVAIFSVEYLARLWSCVELPEHDANRPIIARLKFALSPMLLIDLLAILPFYLSFLIVLDLRFLRVIRVLRVFKLTRYSYAMNTLQEVLKEESSTLAAAGFLLLIALVMASSGIYLLEHQAQPEAFGSIPRAMWWAVVTITTVGYGDVTPVTDGGKLFAALLALLAVVMVALPTGILASGYANALRRRRQQFEQQVDFALEDGKLSLQELAELRKLQKQMGLPEQDAAHIYKLAVKQLRHHHDRCPHCGKRLTVFDEESTIEK